MFVPLRHMGFLENIAANVEYKQQELSECTWYPVFTSLLFAPGKSKSYIYYSFIPDEHSVRTVPTCIQAISKNQKRICLRISLHPYFRQICTFVTTSTRNHILLTISNIHLTKTLLLLTSKFCFDKEATWRGNGGENGRCYRLKRLCLCVLLYWSGVLYECKEVRN